MYQDICQPDNYYGIWVKSTVKNKSYVSKKLESIEILGVLSIY